MITLYTAATPNGWKASVALEEMGLPYTTVALDLLAGDQHTPAFRAINPNGRIPTIVDHEADDFAVFESGAILIYLAEKAGQFLPAETKARSRVLQWLMFQMGGVGPMMGQANVFYRYLPEKIPVAVERYQSETSRLFGVLDQQLADHEYLAGEYSIADIANWCWARTYRWSGVEIEPFPNLHRWIRAIRARPAVDRGVKVPEDQAAALKSGGAQAEDDFAKRARTLVQRGDSAQNS